jgi:uncharacterized membrane protein YeaQ/YmgE (transglycosylase-associated protein family)
MNNPSFIALVNQQKSLAKRNRTVRNTILFLGILLGLLAAFAWLMLSPTDNIGPQTKFIAGIAGGAIFGFLLLSTFAKTLFPKNAACPRCSLNWEIKEGRHVLPKEKMTNWDKCPGCGSPMNEALLAKQ